jgi:hypothetical protein
MIDVLAQDQPQVPLASDQHPVQALMTGTATGSACLWGAKTVSCALTCSIWTM